jgi:hypothetical protein
MLFGNIEQGGLAGAGGAGHGDGDAGGHHGFQQSGRGRVQSSPVDQVAELEPSPREGPDGDHRTVGGKGWQHRVEPLAAREASVDPGPRLVHTQAKGRDHPLHHGGNSRRRGEPHGGPFDAATALYPDVGGAVDQDIGDGRVGEQRGERAEAGQLVADRAHDRRQAGLGQEDPVLAQRLGDRRPEAAGIRRDPAVGGQAPLDPLDQTRRHPANRIGPVPSDQPATGRTAGHAHRPMSHAETAANGITRLARVTIAWTAERSCRSRRRVPSSAAAASSAAAVGMRLQRRSLRAARTSRGARGPGAGRR